IGSKFSVVLATGHQPTKKAIENLDSKVLTSAIKAALELRSLLPKEKKNLPVGVLGVNPHAGESGLLGSEEDELIKPVIDAFRTEKSAVEGPLVPDAAFLPKMWKKYSVYVAAYHDQGLIPFKTVHQHQSGVHISMGLPFVRTSVDHGTAKDIFGRNIADYRSMLESIEWCIKLCSVKN
ncbi:MAG: 4-hydroxythreonine-4-phosphate dehydrogenase PdxA, partial [Pseudobdellovibrionaceae bacterium]